jgi:hypothetical protein
VGARRTHCSTRPSRSRTSAGCTTSSLGQTIARSIGGQLVADVELETWKRNAPASWGVGGHRGERARAAGAARAANGRAGGNRRQLVRSRGSGSQSVLPGGTPAPNLAALEEVSGAWFRAGTGARPWPTARPEWSGSNGPYASGLSPKIVFGQRACPRSTEAGPAASDSRRLPARSPRCRGDEVAAALERAKDVVSVRAAGD